LRVFEKNIAVNVHIILVFYFLEFIFLRGSKDLLVVTPKYPKD